MAIIVALVVVAAIAGIVLVGPRALNRVRGGSSPEDVATSYVAAARSGDALRIRWLMPTDQENLSPIPERIARYRSIEGRTLGITYVPHSVAAYLLSAQIAGDTFSDEIRLQQIGTRWYLIQLP